MRVLCLTQQLLRPCFLCENCGTVRLSFTGFFFGPTQSSILCNIICIIAGRLNSWVVSHLALIIGTLRYGPWVQASVMTNYFSDPSTTSTLYSWFLLDLFDLILLFACQIFMWIVKQKIENKWFFKKIKKFESLQWSSLNRKNQNNS